MSIEKTIPIVVGVTGHRKFREQDRAALYRAVIGELVRLRERCPNSPVVMLNSLCEGADLLCADAAIELDIPLYAVLPMEPEEFELDFSAAEQEHFSRICAEAKEIFVAPDAEATPKTGGFDREFRYRQAGIYIAEHSHILFALWDGNPGAGICGTAETVGFALHGSYDPADGVALRCERNEAVVHIFTPRVSGSDRPAGEVRILSSREEIADLLNKTDDFNRQANCVAAKDEASFLPQDAPKEECLSRMEAVDCAAEALSMFNAKRFRLTLALLAVAGALLTFAFLMYDEAEAIWMILVCGLMLLFAWGLARYAVRSDCLRRYLEFRVLAECLRVEMYLRYAGSSVTVSDLLPWTQQEETAWILCALCALEIGAPQEEKHEIRECWVEDQRRYHEHAEKRSLRNIRISGWVVRTALILSVTLYVAAVIFELLCGHLIFEPSVSVGNVESYRTFLKILLGTISAVTFFIANFYGRLSLDRTRSDHQKMERFFEKMSGLLLQHGQTDQLLTVLAREELIENGNWCSYERDNKPDFNI